MPALRNLPRRANGAVNGVLRSEGGRERFQLDSLWKFYAPEGWLSSTIEYAEGRKNGAQRKCACAPVKASSAGVYFRTSSSFLTAKVTSLSSAISPAMRARASLVSIWRWRKRFSGRAPKTGS